MFLPAPDASPADWLIESLTTFAVDVTSLVPRGFEAYVRVRHPRRADGRVDVGALQPELARAMGAALQRHTQTPDACYFAIWHGFGGGYAVDVTKAATFRLPGREYFLFVGVVGDAALTLVGHQTANLWWPADRAWCVATEIDLYSTYIGCSTTAAAELTSLPGIEAAGVAPETGITFAADPYGVESA